MLENTGDLGGKHMSFEQDYEMPLETEESYLSKIESGKLKLEEKNGDWIPDSYVDELDVV